MLSDENTITIVYLTLCVALIGPPALAALLWGSCSNASKPIQTLHRVTSGLLLVLWIPIFITAPIILRSAF